VIRELEDDPISSSLHGIFGHLVARRLGWDDEAGVTDRLMASPPRDTAMPALPARFAGLILAFAPLFVHRSWRHAQLLLFSAILTPGRRTVTGVLRVMGRAHEWRFGNVHRILNRATSGTRHLS
jgi:hypothetical protein